MIEPIRPPLTERFADLGSLTEAVQRAGREAALSHARAGRPVAVLRDGQVVWLQPAEVLALFAEPPADA
jgi:hypothetical protein